MCDHAHTYESGGDEGKWEEVLKAAQGLIATQDMGLFKTLLEYPKGDRYVDANEAYDLHKEWEHYVKQGKTKYCMVSLGSDNEGGDGWDDGDRGWWEEEDVACCSRQTL